MLREQITRTNLLMVKILLNFITKSMPNITNYDH